MIRGLIPRHSFILWMTVQKRLAITDSLLSWGIQVPYACVLCSTGAAETHIHLFFKCSYSKDIWGKLLKWINISKQLHHWEEEVV
uniref:Uncharacterized protein LOC104212030 n=1 Tax=Nicotiana sylvestris TaxID=4096 RepID=A0A1U7VCH8_NICSY|nr:PREDICTED: uncharacterized protein LOC104212030 [Nicotiana sylvestris]